jgi:hypothetical protein
MNRITGKLITRINYHSGIVGKRDEYIYAEGQKKNLTGWGYFTYDQLSVEDKASYDVFVAQQVIIVAQIEALVRELTISIYVEEGYTQAQAEIAYDTV